MLTEEVLTLGFFLRGGGVLHLENISKIVLTRDNNNNNIPENMGGAAPEVHKHGADNLRKV